MPNPFTSESRDPVVSVNLSGVCTKLRVPSSLRFLFDDAKPKHISIGDTILKDRLDKVLIPAICDGRYQDVQDTLDALFGPRSYKPADLATVVAGGYKRSRNGDGGQG